MVIFFSLLIGLIIGVFAITFVFAWYVLQDEVIVMSHDTAESIIMIFDVAHQQGDSLDVALMAWIAQHYPAIKKKYQHLPWG